MIANVPEEVTGDPEIAKIGVVLSSAKATLETIPCVSISTTCT